MRDSKKMGAKEKSTEERDRPLSILIQFSLTIKTWWKFGPIKNPLAQQTKQRSPLNKRPKHEGKKANQNH